MTRWMRKGSKTNRAIIVVLVLVMGGTSLFNILFMLHTASEITDEYTETEQYDFQAEERQNLLIPTALYWKKRDDSVASSVGKFGIIEEE